MLDRYLRAAHAGIMKSAIQTDEAVVDKARNALAAKRKIRWMMLGYAAVFLGFSVCLTMLGVRKIGMLDDQQLTMGFIYGLAMAVVWTSFGVLGAICLAKFLVGFNQDFRQQELLVAYHDRLRDLGQLPADQT